MDNFLRCNSLPCRKPLQQEGKAVSTSCSHIFCLDCATQLLQGRRNCPACGFRLENADDAIVTVLNPTASYKASVLAGLTPDVIMEICSRAIAFYGYQSSQEAAFQQMLLKKAQESVAAYEREVDRLELSARTEITHLEAKLQSLQNDLMEEKRKSRELNDVLRSNGRDYEKLKSQFDQTRKSTIRTDTYANNHDTVQSGPVFLGQRSNPSGPKSFFNLHEPMEMAANNSNHRQSPRILRENSVAMNRNTQWQSQTPSHSQIPQRSAFAKPPLNGIMTPRASLINRQTPRPRSGTGAGAGLGLRTPVRAMPLPPQGSRHEPRSLQRKVFEDFQEY